MSLYLIIERLLLQLVCLLPLKIFPFDSALNNWNDTSPQYFIVVHSPAKMTSSNSTASIYFTEVHLMNLIFLTGHIKDQIDALFTVN